MTQNWISQVVSSMGSMYNENSDIVSYKKLWIKSWFKSKSFCEYCSFLFYDFWSQTVPIPPEQIFLISLDETVSILFCNHYV